MVHPIDAAEDYLTQSGLIDQPGAVLYSASETVRHGPVYLLGLNPGGTESTTIRDNIIASRQGNNAYLDEEWAPGGRVRPRGRAMLQRRVQATCQLMGLPTRDVPASNLAFARSTRLAAFPSYAAAVEACAPVHRMFMHAIRPDFVLTFGSLGHFASGMRIERLESRDAGHGNWRAHRSQATMFGHRVKFGNVPHLSIWAGDRREDVMRWAMAGFVS